MPKRSAKAIVPCACCFAAFAGIGWHSCRGGGGVRLEKNYKVEIVVKGPDGKAIPIVGRAPR